MTDAQNKSSSNPYPAIKLAQQSDVEHLEPGIKRRLLAFGPSLMAAKVWFEKGAVGTVHSHPHAQIAYVEKGRFEVDVDGEKHVLTAGDSFYAKPGVMHGAVCLEAGVLIDMFSPMREDFLPQKEGSDESQ